MMCYCREATVCQLIDRYLITTNGALQGCTIGAKRPIGCTAYNGFRKVCA